MRIPDDLRKVAGIYNIPVSGDGNSLAQLAFAGAMDRLIRAAERRLPGIVSGLMKRKQLVIVDVGCGYMRYGVALSAVFRKLNPSSVIFAVDKDRLMNSYPAEFVKCDIVDLAKAKPDLECVNIFTVFNPFPGVPELRRLPDYLRRDSLFMGCVDWNPWLFRSSLGQNGFKELVCLENRWQAYMKPWFNNYGPFVLALAQ